jgi:hypothetical protein
VIYELRRVSHAQFQIDLEVGVGNADAPAPQIMVRWSDDAGHTYGNEHWVEIGAVGQYGQRAVIRRLGQARDRVYEVSGTDPVKIALMGAYLDVVDGVS